MTDAEKLKRDIERCAEALNLAPSTVGEKIGQGGQFYARLCAGKRVWPETLAKSQVALQALLEKRCNASHGGDAPSFQGAAE